MSSFRSIKSNPPITSTMGSMGRQISSPITTPIKDEAFHQRNPQAGIAEPPGLSETDDVHLRVVPLLVTTDGTDMRHPSPPSSISDTLDTTISRSGSSIPHTLPVTMPIAETISHGPARRQTAGNRALDTQSPPQASVDTTSSAMKPSFALPKHKKSAFRSVLSKLFGNKTRIVSGDRTRTTSSSQHISAPVASQSNVQKVSANMKRSNSLPIDQYNRALRSHSQQLKTSGSQSTGIAKNGDNMTKLVQSTNVTTSSQGFDDNRQLATNAGLRPRPSSSRAKGIASSNEVHPINTETTGGRLSCRNSRRRSRSLNITREKAVSNEILSRSYSDEIKYWRESDIPAALSPASSNKENLAPSSEDEQLYNDTAETTLQAQPPQPFNFEPLGELAGMKITDKVFLEKRVSQIENRLEFLECKVIHMEDYAKPTTSHFPVASDYNPQRKCHNPQAAMAFTHEVLTELVFDSQPSSADTTKTSSTQILVDLSSQPTLASGLHVPTSTTTDSGLSCPSSNRQVSSSNIELNNSNLACNASATIPSMTLGHPTNPTFPNFSTPKPNKSKSLPTKTPQAELAQISSSECIVSMQNYIDLLHMITEERNSRLRLEDQISRLQHQLHATLRATWRTPELEGSSMFGAARDESSISTLSPQCSGTETLVHDERGLGLDGMLSAEPASSSRSELGRIEHVPDLARVELNGKHAKVTEGSDSDDATPSYDNDVFQTPREEKEYDELAFDTQQEQPHMRSRTMSVGRMTLKRNVAVAV